MNFDDTFVILTSMKPYELTVVIPGKATAAKKKDVVERIGKIISAQGGKVEKSEDWGVKELSYVIKKNSSGNFLYFEISLPASSVKGIKEKIKVDDDIIRYLLVRSEK